MRTVWGGARWTPEEDKLLHEMRDAGASRREISQALNRSMDSICGRINRDKPDKEEKHGVIYETPAQKELRERLYGNQRYA
jgi:IS30 family transposase